MSYLWCISMLKLKHSMGMNWFRCCKWVTYEASQCWTIFNHPNLNVLTNVFKVHIVHFYTPVWKTGRIMPWQCPSVRLSVRLSVRPSVRPCFPDFSSTCFEISIWNLVYTFSRWHDMSSLSCIKIGSLWPSLQPKVGQTYFFSITAS